MDTIYVMSVGGDNAGIARESSPDGMTCTDGEHLLMADSIMDLGTWLHQLAVMAEQYVADIDRIPAGDSADRSLSAQMVSSEVQLGQSEAESMTRQATEPFQWLASELAGLGADCTAERYGVVADLPAEDVALASYLMQYSQAGASRPLLPVLRRNLLIATVASAETMLTRVLRHIQHGRGSGTRLGPLWDTHDIDDMVRRLTRGDIQDWAPRLSRILGIDLSAAACDWPAVTELWERANALVRSAGLADRKYVERVPGAVLGALLEVDSRYLREAIDLLCGFLLGVTLQTWAACPGGRDLAIQMATLHVATAESDLRWPLAETLHTLVAQLEEDPMQAAASQLRAWLARIHWRGHHSVLAEVTAWPVADLPQRFTLARTILLGQLDEAIATLPGLIDQGLITKDNLRDCPLFELLSSEPEFQLLLAD